MSVPDYLRFFGFQDYPFRLTPDTRYFFPSSKHKAVLETIRYALARGEGFLVLVGDPGIGKTMLLRILLKELADDRYRTALIMTPTLEPKELLQAILEDVQLPVKASDSKERLLRIFQRYLLHEAAQGREFLLVVDEAQNLPPESLEEIRLLSNLETEDKKLIQILLVGQRSLEDKLHMPQLSQLKQRISLWERLEPLSPDEVSWYTQYRMTRAGGASIPFEKGAEKLLCDASGRIPRLINKIMDRALLVAASRLEGRISVETLREVLKTLEPTLEASVPSLRPGRSWLWGGVLAVTVGLAVLGVWWVLGRRP
ncbi:ExeA family protein [Desulfosoma caldarium]|uniref:General secretion pathway protein A n=1 Tax=Desulfosoma caldarium TaxID=610254 RepID=A0A3N1UU73_9BACT|nr:AAA family ATPase [Desulfosoma caldarium]ROQ90666.1 general secretion pathway protein A [Desulfosoma caldarium]